MIITSNFQVFYSTVNPDKTLYNQLIRQARKHYGAQGEVYPEVAKPKKVHSECKAHTGGPFCTTAYEVPEKKESMAKKLHDRISRTLQSIPRYFEEMKEMCTEEE